MARIERVPVWGGWLRLSHAAVGLSALVLIVTGWLLEAAPSLEADAADFHYYAASVLMFGLVLRVVLAFAGSPLEAFDKLIPEDGELRAMRDMLLFYLTLGRAPLPRWYAHNPLWKPVYLVFYLCLAILVLTGWLREDQPLLWGWYLPSVHGIFASAVAWLSLLHILSVVLHDYRGDAADISAIINGHRYFTVETPEVPLVAEPMASIKLTDLVGTRGQKDE